MKKVLIAAAILVATAVMAAAQQAPCKPRAEGLAIIETWGEELQRSEMSPEGSLLELWADLDTGKWTVTVTTNGLICLVSSGSGFVRSGFPV